MNTDTTPVVIDTRSNAMFMIGSFLARYPQRTRYLYRIHLRHWWEWCEAHGIDPLLAMRGHIEAYSRHLLEERGLQKQTVASKLTVVKGFYKYSYLDGMIAADPGVHVRRPKCEFVSTTKSLTRGEYADVIKVAQRHGPMEMALVMMLGFNTLRISECLGSNIEHLGYERGHRTLFLPDRKGGRTGVHSLAIPTMWAVEQAIEGRTSGPILVGRDGERLKVGSARRRIAVMVAEAGIKKRITPHSFRHTGVTLAIDAGASQNDIVNMAGWVSANMLGYYDRNREAIERSPTHILAAFVGIAS